MFYFVPAWYHLKNITYKNTFHGNGSCNLFQNLSSSFQEVQWQCILPPLPFCKSICLKSIPDLLLRLSTRICVCAWKVDQIGYGVPRLKYNSWEIDSFIMAFSPHQCTWLVKIGKGTCSHAHIEVWYWFVLIY